MTRIGVVAHYSRMQMAHTLVRDISADYISVDRGDRGPIANHRRTWEHLNSVAGRNEWCFVLEDDAQPVGNLRGQLTTALSHLPKRADVVSLYLGRKRPPQWQDKVRQAVYAAESSDASWILADIVLHGVAVGMTGWLVAKMLHATRHSLRPFDEAMSQWARTFDHVVAYSFPSLCDHLDRPSLINDHFDGAMREPGRVAWNFGTPAHWTDRSVSL